MNDREPGTERGTNPLQLKEVCVSLWSLSPLGQPTPAVLRPKRARPGRLAQRTEPGDASPNRRQPQREVFQPVADWQMKGSDPHPNGLLLFLVRLGITLFFLGFADIGLAQMTEAKLAEIPAGRQPIKFSHKIHAGDNLIPCQYCHIYARRSQVSGVPPVAICMGCHKFVATGLSEVKKLASFWQEQKPIPWVKIHDVPDFVRYRHDSHINAKTRYIPRESGARNVTAPLKRCTWWKYSTRISA